LIAKKHEYEYKITLAVCDKEHLGKTFEEGNICFTVSEKFYGGEKISEEELVALLKEADSVNLFGDKCVGIAQKNGFVGEKSPILIKGIKHAQIYRV
jgi:hypothetical protein